jgi:hypothetical protein
MASLLDLVILHPLRFHLNFVNLVCEFCIHAPNVFNSVFETNSNFCINYKDTLVDHVTAFRSSRGSGGGGVSSIIGQEPVSLID